MAAAVGALLHDTPVAGQAGGPIGSDKAIFIKPSSAWACCNVKALVFSRLIKMSRIKCSDRGKRRIYSILSISTGWPTADRT